MAKTFTLPAPTGPDGQILTAEQLEQLAQEPSFVTVPVSHNGETYNFTVAADFDQVDNDADHRYQLAKGAMYRVYVESRPKPKNSKYTNIQRQDAEDEPDDIELTPEQNERLIELRPRVREVHIGLLFPKDYLTNPVILGTNVPGMPEDSAEQLAWFNHGGHTAMTVLEEIIVAYDPTGPLAQQKLQAKRAEDLSRQMDEVLSQKLEELSGLELQPKSLLSTEDVPSLNGSAPETGQTPAPPTPSDDSEPPLPGAGDAGSPAESSASPTDPPSSTDSATPSSPPAEEGTTTPASSPGGWPISG